ncbi:MAG: DUF2865 domain-containing protein [Xanthobacteraceae bacterium]|nr:DUF2865 domain-containing protein [Xanthobacteraceae bacterium]
MIVRPRKAFCAHLTGLVIAAMTVTAVVLPSPPASAQGLFDFLFRDQRRPGPPPNASAYADPSYPGFERERGGGAPSGIAGTFCVRLCDGRYFPIQRSGGANPAQLCNAFCPAAETRTFSGTGIDHAVASDGTRYASLRTAFAYRERVVQNCTCNGRDPYGLVALNPAEDTSLRQDDIVATNEGFVAYRGGGRGGAEFTPIASYPGLSPEWRQRLAETRIAPNNATPVPPEAVRRGAATRDDRGRQVQLDR